MRMDLTAHIQPTQTPHNGQTRNPTQSSGKEMEGKMKLKLIVAYCFHVRGAGSRV